MQFLSLSVFALQLAVGAAEVLHSPSNPKLILFSGDETAGVNSWDDANRFCRSHGRLLASRREWCDGQWKNFGPEDVYGGVKDGEQWAPVRGPYHNDWVSIGDNDASKACSQYSDIYGPELIGEERVDDTVYCAKPDGCTGDKCDLGDVRAEGYYPDPTDCTAFCYYSGTNSGSYWERTPEEGKVWDPYCGDSDELQNFNKPLAGMTGGCFHPERYVNDLSYCTPESGAHRMLANRQRWNAPEWGLDDTRFEGSNNFILCTLIEKLPEMPQTCASVYGDPHVITYDGLKYDNQGEGDYILQKSLDSSLEIQGRFNHFSDMQASVTRAVTINTGRDDEPVVEATYTGRCSLRYWIDGTEHKLDIDSSQDGTFATGTTALHFINKGIDKYFWFPGSGMSVHLRRKKSSAMGCYMNVKVCLSDGIVKEERLVGLLGSPNGDKSDDFMARDGTNLDHQDKTEWGDAYRYSHTNWCLDKAEDNKFLTPQDGELCKAPYDPAIENAVKAAPEWLKEICGDDTACLTDGLAGGKEDSLDVVEEERELEQKEEIESDEVGEKTVETEEKQTTEVSEERTRINPRGGGDPHFRTWTGKKFDYHGECDLVLLDHPGFADGLGMKVHIRTTRVHYFSYIETIAVQIGDETLEFSNDLENYLINGVKVADGSMGSKNHIAGYEVRRYQRALSIRLDQRKHQNNHAHIDLYYRKNGFPYVKFDGKDTDVLEGSTGLLGDYHTGKMMARDGSVEISDPTEFALEWQVRDTEPMLFEDSRFPQFPTTCTPPKKMLGKRLGDTHLQNEAEKACAAWGDEKEECIFDVMATRSIHSAEPIGRHHNVEPIIDVAPLR